LVVLFAGSSLGTPATAGAQGLLALGDSYSSGEGVPPFDQGTDTRTNRCHRSQGAWPILAATDLALPAVSRACSGAETSEIEDQLAPIAPAPSIVTLTAGGNDVHFRDVLTTCVLRLQSCDRYYTRRGIDRVEDDIHDVENALIQLYSRVAAVARDARIVVVGYPRIFPHPVRSGKGNCGAAFLISAGEADYLNEKTDSLNRAIRRATARAGVEFVDVSEAFRGHELRCGRKSWVHRLELLRKRRLVAKASFHPDARGHRRIAELVVAHVNR
jgi:lysophospholipase L1-like esterase